MNSRNNRIAIFISSSDKRNLIIEYLTYLGYEILSYQEEGWTQADLFILDAQSASEIGKQILDLKQKVDTFLPVLIILDKDDDIDYWLSKGFDDCLLLPISDAVLKAEVELLLRIRKKSEKFTQKSESIYQAIFEATGTATLIVEEDTTITMANRTCLEVTGYGSDELIGTKWTKYVAPESLEMMLRYHKLSCEDPEKAPLQYEVKLLNKSGEERIALLQVKMIPETKQSVVSMLDITEQKGAEKALKEREDQLQGIFRAAPTGIGVVRDRILLEVNARICEMTGFTPDELIGKSSRILYPNQKEFEYVGEEKYWRIAEKGTGVVETKWMKKDGSVIDVLLSSTPVDVKDKSKGVIFTVLDITERKRAKEKLRQASASWSKTFDAIQDGIALVDANQVIVNCNKAFLNFIDKTEEEVIGRHCFTYIHGTDCSIEGCPFVRMQKSKQREMIELRINAKICQVSVDPILDENRNLTGAVHIISDITDRKRMEEALIDSEKNYRRLFEDHVAIKLLIDPDSGQIVDANKAATDFYGWNRDELKNMKIQQINTLSPDEIKKEMEKARKLKKTHFEFRHRLADGSIRDVRVFSSKVEIKGKDYLHSIIHDVTKEKELESQLFQAQKLESIGRLAGGIAHDFNNMLNVILGYGEMVLNKLHPQDTLRKDMLQIIEAGRRSMSLTQQLLAFSRKQIMQPKILNINESLKAIEEMLRRLIGENIELTMVLAEEISNVKADPGQIEQVIMNLVVNARDAMPYGGKLIIDTANVILDESYVQNRATVDPKDYVMIAVTDTGTGMDKATLSQLFEPFFTTKGEKGTGLGLSTVYGIVKQSGGHIHVYSEPGKGSTFKIYLPAVSETTTEVKKEEREAELKVGEGHILIVEDEPSLQDLFKAMLTILGYQVTVAANGGEALLLIEEKGIKPDLIITDIIMPVMNGKVLVERLRKKHPDMKALYMSGYTDNAIVHYGVLDADIPFIQKPFNLKELAAKIEQLLRA